MREDLEDRIEKVANTSKDLVRASLDEKASDHETTSDAEAVEAERTGRTNADRAATQSQRPMPSRWDSIGEGGEGLDDLQGLYVDDTSARKPLSEGRVDPSPSAIESPAPADTAITPALWDQLMTLEGQTVETPKGEPFGVQAVVRGEHVTVVALDGGQEWNVPAHELEVAWRAVNGGLPLDGLASIRLQDAGLDSAHPEYVAGLLRTVKAGI